MSSTPKPISWDDFAHEPSGDLAARFGELSLRDSIARHIIKRQTDGTYDPQRHADPALYPPLTLAERLTLLALGEAIARWARHPSYVHHAVLAGASWTQISTALGITAEDARKAYRTWADGQHHLHTVTSKDGKPFGLDDAEYAAALAAAERTDDGGTA